MKNYLNGMLLKTVHVNVDQRERERERERERSRAEEQQLQQQQRVPAATLERAALASELIRQSPIPIPMLRKAALREAMRVTETEEGLRDIFLEAICGSPYVAEGRKQELADAVFGDRWEELPRLVGLNQSTMTIKMETTKDQADADFKYMAAGIFRKSRKIRQLPTWRRRILGSSLLTCTTKDQIIHFMLRALEKARTIDEKARMLVADDVFEGKFHRLLLSDRFDCDDLPRLGNSPNDTSEPPEDCIICFGPYQNGRPTTLAVCGHQYCHECIQDWAQRNGDPFPCPTCRRANTLEPYCQRVPHTDTTTCTFQPQHQTTTTPDEFWS